MQITGAVLTEPAVQLPYRVSKPLAVLDLELSPPGPGELLVRIDAAGLCHSDLSVVNGSRPRPTPMLLGHEAAATVIGTGPGVVDFLSGDKVVLVFLPSCQSCAACAAGRPVLCAAGAAANSAGHLLAGGSRLSRAGQPVYHHLGVSAFASHAVVDQRSAVKIPDGIAPEIAALFGCAVLTGVGAVINTASARPGESIAVFGLGGVGLSAVLGAVLAAAHPIYAIDPVPAKRALALELGATLAADPADLDQILPVNLGGVDIAVETVGRASVLIEAYHTTARGGRTVTVGLPDPGEAFTVPAVSLVADAKTVLGSYMGDSVPRRDIPRYIELWRAGRLPVDRLLTSTNSLSDVNTLLDELASGAAVRQIILPDK